MVADIFENVMPSLKKMLAMPLVAHVDDTLVRRDTFLECERNIKIFRGRRFFYTPRQVHFQTHQGHSNSEFLHEYTEDCHSS